MIGIRIRTRRRSSVALGSFNEDREKDGKFSLKFFFYDK